MTPVPAGQPANRGDREGDDQETKRPDAGRQLQIFNRVDSQAAGERSDDEPDEAASGTCRKTQNLRGLLHAAQ